jgi:DNA modification methylase
LQEKVYDNHPTQKPLTLYEKLMKASKNKDSTLLVVFMGSGSECITSKKEHINFIIFEINQYYIEIH